MRPERPDIAAPELPGNVRWLVPAGDGEAFAGVAPADAPSMGPLSHERPVLVHFFDFAQLNCLRALPYLNAWRRRYEPLGLAVLGVHSPRHPFTADRKALAAALPGLGVEHPVADDSSYEIWHDYGCEGWPALFLWSKGGALRWAHFGEGEYRETELEIQRALAEAVDEEDSGGDAVRDAGGSSGSGAPVSAPDPGALAEDPASSAGPGALEPAAAADRIARGLPEPMSPLRATDEPGAPIGPATPELLPGGDLRTPWQGGGEPIRADYEAGGVAASVDGSGELRIAIDGGETRAIAVSEPGLVVLAEHPRHESHSLELAAGPGVRVWAVSFAPGVR